MNPNEKPPALWLLPALTALLGGLAAWQVVAVVPRCVWVAQHLGRPRPAITDVLLNVPAPLALAVTVGLAALAFWQRRSARRSALLAAVAVALNLGVQMAVLASLSAALSAVG